jgi:hypothetical protein
LGILEPVLQTGFLRSNPVQPADEEEQIASADNAEEDVQEDTHASPFADGKVPRSQQARLAQLVGDAMIHVGRIADALSYYQTARRLEASLKEREVILHKISEARSILRVESENAARQPLLHEALDQDRLVRPRLLTRTARLSKGADRKGDIAR